jgi:SAM-dependent methyltransferase
MGGWCNDETGEFIGGVYVKPGMQVVDIGCGDGGYINFCSSRGADVTFVDIQEAKVAALEERLKQRNDGGTVKGIVSDCDPIPLENHYADLVISTEVIEHVRDPKKVLTEIVRIGKPDAYYVITVPDARGENMVLDIAPPEYFQEPNHINIFTSDEFEQLAEDCGLEVIRHEYLAGFWAIFFLLKWATSEPGENLLTNVHPATTLWTQTWHEVMQHPNGPRIRHALDNALPRGQVIVARRKGANLG